MVNRFRIMWLQLRNIVGFSPSEVQFDRALPVFMKAVAQKRRERISILCSGRARLGAENARMSRDPFSGRVDLYREHADSLGKTFLESFKTIVVANCREIPSKSLPIMLNELNQIYSSAIQNARDSELHLAQSLGRQEQLKSFVVPIEHVYSDARSRHSDILQSEIEQFNLSTSTNRLQSRRKRTTSLVIQIISYVITFVLGLLMGKWRAGK